MSNGIGCVDEVAPDKPTSPSAVDSAEVQPAGETGTAPLQNAADGQSVESTADEVSSGPDREFIQQFVKAQRRLYLYLLAQTADPGLAEEVLQNTNVVILSKWTQFEPGTNFLAWVYRIASLELLKYRQKRRRGRLMFDDEFIQSVAETVEELDESSEPRRQALATCLGKLRPRDREIIQLRYQLGNNGQKLSETLDRPLNSIYQSLSRIRRTLFECIQREMTSLTR
ncbi:MAG: sigma-70 family RNA polymerase sigma factor [Rubinisphaera brasiliensis]|uniref:RNA polymerase, sigma-24 subunit, ECF subfamily n=1 Tax=Rubinisphaera brasiliensis (strain ATCC 49424 / DSM 5305 / JCM 21570 / IAM 15109 / NBRC 103401 / IFAM 1448) TaxID=756272 RepID=F0SQB8_RUBBR|nr:sigma-70 family RNA polymerase sigma factor [Rubinisphaera brasiliensis]ADY62297.1 RNA polymerase, sigma-24 subunit, ECF subfamily [Rubinisphaera brasiliensis DSM 5305]